MKKESMSNKRLSSITQGLLTDPDFVMWCFLPTEELNSKWQQWLAEHPDEHPAFDQALAILKSARLNDYSIPKEKSEQIWMRLEQSLKNKRKKKVWFYTRYAVACLVILLVSASLLWIQGWKNTPETKLVSDIPAKIDSTHSEVTLIINNQEAITIEDNSLIAYDSDIKIKSKEKEKTIAQQAKSNHSEAITMNTLVVPRGRRSSLQLADGSKIWINSGSRLQFPSRFEEDKRTIEVEGEIYIEVVKDKTPFYVKTKNFTVNVLGTKFNISAYADDQVRSVVLVEGSVMVKTDKDEKIRLSPCEKLSLGKEKNKIEKVDVYDYISWKDGLLSFNTETMGNIMTRLSRYYNVPIQCAPSLAKRRSSGKLVLFDDIKQVMETFSMLYNTRYQMESDTLHIQ